MITYPEGGIPGALITQKHQTGRQLVDTVRVQLVPLRPTPKAKINSPEDVARLVRELENADREYAKVIHLDTKNQVVNIETISIGSLNASIVHPREAVKGALLANAAATIFVHNHPSGICGPSNEDVEISRTLKDAFALVGIEMLDSIIVGKGCHYSLRETGFFTGRTEKFTVSEDITNLPKEERMRIAHGIAVTIGPQQEPGKFITLDEISKLPVEERKKYLQMISAGQIKSSVVREPAREKGAEVEKFIAEKYGYDATHGVAQNIETARYLLGHMKFYSVMNTDTLENDTIQFNLDEEVVQRPVTERQFKTDKKEFSIKTDGYQNLNGEITPRFILNVTSPIVARGVFWSTSVKERQGIEGINFSEYSDFAKIMKAKPGQDVTFILPKEALQFIREKSRELTGTRLPSMQIYHFRTAFRRYIEKKIIPKGMNVYDFLTANATLDKEWVKERNKEFTHTAILKYNYNESLKEKINAVIREIIQDLEKLLAEQQEKEAQVKKAKEGKKELDFEYHDSWETGLQFLVIHAGVDKETFSKLQKEAGLNYHQYDAEMEERFTGWATTNIEKAWQILRDAGYYRPERA